MIHKNILVADDDTSLRTMVAVALNRFGHKVTVTGDGKEALELYTQDPDACDILITDHSMPVMTGLELVGQIRNHGFKGKIIVMSGSLTKELEAAYRAKQVNKILQKPFTMETLQTLLESLLKP